MCKDHNFHFMSPMELVKEAYLIQVRYGWSGYPGASAVFGFYLDQNETCEVIKRLLTEKQEITEAKDAIDHLEKVIEHNLTIIRRMVGAQ